MSHSNTNAASDPGHPRHYLAPFPWLVRWHQVNTMRMIYQLERAPHSSDVTLTRPDYLTRLELLIDVGFHRLCGSLAPIIFVAGSDVLEIAMGVAALLEICLRLVDIEMYRLALEGEEWVEDMLEGRGLVIEWWDEWEEDDGVSWMRRTVYTICDSVDGNVEAEWVS